VVLPPVGVLELLGDEVVNGGTARPARHLQGHPARRGNPTGGTATDLEDARAQLSQYTAQNPALPIWGGPCRVPPPRRGRAESERASQHAFADQTLHGLDLLRRGLSPLRGCLTHDIAPDPRVADQGPDVDATPLAEGLKVPSDGLPGEVDSLMYCAQGNGLRRREKFQVPVMVSRPRRGEHLSALAHDHAGVTVLHGVTAKGVPERLRIIVRVMFNESGGDCPPLGIDDARGGFIELANPYNLPIVYRHIRGEGRPSGAVNYASVLNEQVICHDAS